MGKLIFQFKKAIDTINCSLNPFHYYTIYASVFAGHFNLPLDVFVLSCFVEFPVLFNLFYCLPNG